MQIGLQDVGTFLLVHQVIGQRLEVAVKRVVIMACNERQFAVRVRFGGLQHLPVLVLDPERIPCPYVIPRVRIAYRVRIELNYTQGNGLCRV